MTSTTEPTVPVVLAIQNDPTDPPLLIGEWLGECGIEIRLVGACFGEPVPAKVPDGIHGILPLGGSMGANDDDLAPWLANERALLVDALDLGIPILGLCLGAQLLAAASGGTVALGTVTEIGVVQVFRTLDGVLDSVIGSVENTSEGIPAAQWHQDHITELPEGAVLLLTNSDCRVQGFRLGDTAYGLQLHPEVDADAFISWAADADEALERSGRDPIVLAEEVRAAEVDLVRVWRPMARAWGDLVWTRAVTSALTGEGR